MVEKFHIGVYGIIIRSGSILLINKARGPYKGLLDLPGGKHEKDESLLDTLKREIQEETGIIVTQAQPYIELENRLIYHEKGHEIRFYHKGHIYKIIEFEEKGLKTGSDGQDSQGADWYKLLDLGQKQLSPFALEIVKNS